MGSEIQRYEYQSASKREQKSMRYFNHIFLPLFVFFTSTSSVFSAPDTSLYLDELGSASSNYTVVDSQNSHNGTVYSSDSVGSGLGKICSGIDLRPSGISDYVKLDQNSLHGATDFTISIWHKGSSSAGRSLLSGARSAQKNEIL